MFGKTTLSQAIFALTLLLSLAAQAQSTETSLIFDPTSETNSIAMSGDESAELSGASFFDGMDTTFQDPRGNASLLAAHRYYRLSARTSVFALYCDDGNKLKLNQLFSRFRSKTSALEKSGEKALGGTVAAYNEFEDARNAESLVFAALDDLDPICKQNMVKFKTYMSSNASKLGNDLASAAFGTR